MLQDRGDLSALRGGQEMPGQVVTGQCVSISVLLLFSTTLLGFSLGDTSHVSSWPQGDRLSPRTACPESASSPSGVSRDMYLCQSPVRAVKRVP